MQQSFPRNSTIPVFLANHGDLHNVLPLTPSVAYTEAINLMDYSAVVIPVTKADKAVDKADPDHVPLNDLDKLNWEAFKHGDSDYMKHSLTSRTA